MLRKIIHIDKEKCNGCGLCAAACHEGAIEMANGKAHLAREDHCDGLGDCLPACPTGAISFVEREAPAYDQAAVDASRSKKAHVGHGGCPGSRARTLKSTSCTARPKPISASSLRTAEAATHLAQWPCQIKLVPVNAPYFDGAHLLIAADCTAYAYGGFHSRFMKNRITLIGCPKLDGIDYANKLAEILITNDILSLTVVRMEVPCCGGIENAVKNALKLSGKLIPWQVITISTDGKILE